MLNCDLFFTCVLLNFYFFINFEVMKIVMEELMILITLQKVKRKSIEQSMPLCPMLCSKCFPPEENHMLAGGHYGSSVPFYVFAHAHTQPQFFLLQYKPSLTGSFY